MKRLFIALALAATIACGTGGPPMAAHQEPTFDYLQGVPVVRLGAGEWFEAFTFRGEVPAFSTTAVHPGYRGMSGVPHILRNNHGEPVLVVVDP